MNAKSRKCGWDIWKEVKENTKPVSHISSSPYLKLNYSPFQREYLRVGAAAALHAVLRVPGGPGRQPPPPQLLTRPAVLLPAATLPLPPLPSPPRPLTPRPPTRVRLGDGVRQADKSSLLELVTNCYSSCIVSWPLFGEILPIFGFVCEA